MTRWFAFAVLCLAVPVVAQTQLQVRPPLLYVLGPEPLEAYITNEWFDIPQPPYTLPDPSASLYIGTSVFQFVTAEGDSIGLGAPLPWLPVNRDFVLARRADGTRAFGCVSEADSTSDIANATEIAGQVAVISRGGGCPFYVKALNAHLAGALGYMIYNPPDRVPDTISNMGGGRAGDPFIPIPGVLLTWGMAAPLVGHLESGGDLWAYLCEAECLIPAAEGAPGADGSRLVIAGPNPSAGSTRLVVHAATPQHVVVTAHDVLGREVARLLDGAVHGEQRVTLSGVPPGVYFVRAEGATFRQAQQVTILH